MQRQEFKDVLRGLITQAQSEPPMLSIPQIALLCGVSEPRLRRFKNGSNTLPLEEARRIYEKLSGKPLLPNVR